MSEKQTDLVDSNSDHAGAASALGSSDEDAMREEATQEESTQEYDDPRRHGYYHEGLSSEDVVDVICLLHPISPAAGRVAQNVLQYAPHHVAQKPRAWVPKPPKGTVETPDEYARRTAVVMTTDIALRLSSPTMQPVLGFTFGRNAHACDVVFDLDSSRRVSNTHFRIFINNGGVLMLEDMSTNGTFVDNVHLKGKSNAIPATRMLSDGTFIQIPSTVLEETIRFRVVIPSREPWTSTYLERLREYTDRQLQLEDAEIERRRRNPQDANLQPNFLALRTPSASLAFSVMNNKFGMHWSGGDQYVVVGPLGKGAFATVYRIALRRNGTVFAAKELEKKRFMKDGRLDARLDNELQIMKTIRHDNVVQFVDWHEETNHLYIIMEFVPGGDLQNHLSHVGCLSEDHARSMARQMLLALVYLHQKRITHRDIKPDNILIASLEPFKVKLSDFGLSKIVKNNETFLKTFCGTLLFCAPEVFPHYDDHVASQADKKRRRGQAPPTKFHSYSHSVDVWSFAAVLWLSLAGVPPFQGVHDKTGLGMFQKIMQTELDISPLRARGVSHEAIDMLLGMLRTDPSQRLTEFQCLQHPWLENGEPLPDFEPPSDLESIVEDVEAEAAAEEGAERQFSQLSITGRSRRFPPQEDPEAHYFANGEAEDASDDDDDDFDDDDDDLDWLHDGQAAVVKSDVLRPRNQVRDPDLIPSSSGEVSVGDEKDGDDEEDDIDLDKTIRRTSIKSPRGKLFGEISQNAVQTSGAAIHGTSKVVERDRDSSQEAAAPNREKRQRTSSTVELGEAQATSSRFEVNSGHNGHHPSLLGAESMVRDLNMESPGSVLSPDDEPQTPHTPEQAQHRQSDSTNVSQRSHPSQNPQDLTPKPAPPSKFSRIINLEKPPSIYYDPTDLATHNLEYASKVSGHDYVSEAAQKTTELQKTMNPNPSIPATEHPSFGPDLAPPVPASTSMGPPAWPAIPMAVPSEIANPPARMGMLITTTDSYTSAFVKLEQRFDTWGRLPAASHVFPDVNDTRIPKVAIAIIHHAPGIEKVEAEGKDWTKLEGLQTFLRTRSSVGLLVNGVRLHARSANDKEVQYGTLHTGDVITVFDGHNDKGEREVFRFVCEFYHGEAKLPRPKDGPAFKIGSKDLSE